MKVFCRFFAAGCLAALLPCCAKVQPRDPVALRADDRRSGAEATIRVAYQESDDWPKASRVPTPAHAAALAFKAGLEEATGGKIAVELYGNALLGDDGAALELLQTGRLEMAIVGPLAAKVFPSLQMINLPYLFDRESDLLRFFDEAPLWQEMAGNFTAQTGLAILGTGSRGFAHLGNTKRGVRTPRDLDTLTINTPDLHVYRRTLEALGAFPRGNPESEAAGLLRDKAVDGTAAPLWVMDSRHWYLREPHLTLTAHALEEALILGNSAFLAGLTEAQQGAVRAAAKQGEQAYRLTAQLLGRTVRFAALESVTAVYVPTAEERAAFAAATRGVAAWLGSSEVGDGLLQRFLEAVKK